jgi:hypothetical protein
MNRFPKLPTYEVHPKIFVIDDRGVDYGDGNMTMTSSIEPPPIPRPGGGEPRQPPFIAPTVPIPGVPLLRIEIIEGGVKRLLFDSEPGIVYRLEESTDLSAGVWNTLETIVATDTQTRFLTPENSMAFYRVIKGATAIQFPDWHDSIEQFLYFDVYSPVVGTYGLELYGDGVLKYSTNRTIPPDGSFGVYDYANYDPAQWPYTGYYAVNEWELRVTVTPTAGTAGPAAPPSTAQVKKKGLRRPVDNYWGISVQQAGIANPATQAQEDLDQYLRLYLQANLQVTRQKNLDEAELDALSDAPVLAGAGEWAKLRSLLTSATKDLDYFHYFGHGAPNSIGSGAGGVQRIVLPTLQSGRLRHTPLTYAAIDGCRAGEDTAFLKALVSHATKVSRQKARDNGLTPRYAASWDRTKAVGFVAQGELFDDHFYFWVDFYNYLTARDGQGFMFHTYEEAFAFAKEPRGAGVHPTMQINMTAGGFVQVGCHECFFDE